jgi:histidinol dehydrogenase
MVRNRFQEVDKIVGPGNVVTTAKRLVYGVVDIDSIAGPLKSLWRRAVGRVAADLMAQAEHDPTRVPWQSFRPRYMPIRVAAAESYQLQ